MPTHKLQKGKDGSWNIHVSKEPPPVWPQALRPQALKAGGDEWQGAHTPSFER